MRLILARHGQAWGNVDPLKHTGHDTALTPLGEQQADRLGQWLRQREPEIDQIYVSPLQRARKTAELANQHLNLPVEVVDGLAEITRYDLPHLLMRAHPFDSASVTRSPEDDGFYDTYREKVNGALNFLMRDLERPKPILVVSHGGTMATIMRLILERHDIYFHTNNTGVYFLEWGDGRWRFSGMNWLAHLPPDLVS